ncbi:MAG: 1-(5-phosphoribosyl)-5-[(5-phosphoribosylamino)methylideneamino]imidazole-4-carboxamide isomerase [Bacteroidales bacterium]|nr:1-(5-phosphoribosyl)-5-[(5-phosphoribosylamino)methylideneamino]imidazole-4-carboxamide isomerase [Candidatus Cacconaster merdequi]
MIEIIPAIDLISGRCVRLSKGDYSTRKEYGDPFDMARQFADAGALRLHLVDLDGAKESEPRNLATLERIASLGTMKIEWGGGIKSRDALKSVLESGADFAIIGSVAATYPELFEEWLEEFGAGHIIFGADTLEGRLRVKGWLESAPMSLNDLLKRFSDHGLKQVICTDISRDGMLSGPNTELYVGLQNSFPKIDFTVSGGISSMDDIRSLDLLGLRRVIAGKAFYEGKIKLEDLGKWWQNE